MPKRELIRPRKFNLKILAGSGIKEDLIVNKKYLWD